MIDHLSTYATDFTRTQRFYQAVLGELGYLQQAEFVAEWNSEFPTQRLCAFGPPATPVFWVIESKVQYTPRHVAFSAATRTLVDTFYHTAMKCGGEDNGPPGLRPVYHEHYYGAFVIDPDGNNVEAVCHVPQM